MCGRSASRERFEGRGGVKRRRTFGALGAAFANALRQVIDDEAEHRKRNAAVKRDALIRIEAHADHDGDAEDRPHDGHEGEPGALVLELGEIMPFGKELLAEAVVRNRNAQPHGDRREAHDRGEDHEDRVGRHDARTESEEPADHAEGQGVHGNAALVELGEALGHHAVLPERPDHAARGVEARVGRGEDRRDDDEVEDVRRVRNAEVLKDRDEGALRDRHLFGRDERRDDEDRPHEEDDEAQKRGANGDRNHAFGRVRFARGDADELGPRIGKAHRHHREEQGRKAVGQKVAVPHEVREAGRARFAERNHVEEGAGAEHDEDLNRHDLHDREREFALREELRVDDVQKVDDRAEDDAPHPYRHLREPVLHGKAHGREGRAERDRPVEPVEPRHRKARGGRDVLARVEMEGTGFGMRHGELSEAQHDQVHHEGADQIRDDRAEGTHVRDDVTRSEKESAADYAAETQHDQVAQPHRALKLGLVVRRNILGIH